MLDIRNDGHWQSSREHVFPSDRREERLIFHFARSVRASTEPFFGILSEQFLDECFRCFIDRSWPDDSTSQDTTRDFAFVLIGIEGGCWRGRREHDAEQSSSCIEHSYFHSTFQTGEFPNSTSRYFCCDQYLEKVQDWDNRACHRWWKFYSEFSSRNLREKHNGSLVPLGHPQSDLPKSTNLTWPSASRRIFSGFRSPVRKYTVGWADRWRTAVQTLTIDNFQRMKILESQCDFTDVE